jgi:hypothetical protein
MSIGALFSLFKSVGDKWKRCQRVNIAIQALLWWKLVKGSVVHCIGDNVVVLEVKLRSYYAHWHIYTILVCLGIRWANDSMVTTSRRKYSVIYNIIICIVYNRLHIPTYRNLTTLTNLFLQEMLPVLLFFRVGITYFYVTTWRPKHLFDDGACLRRI